MRVYLIVYDTNKHRPLDPYDAPPSGIVVERVGTGPYATLADKESFCEGFNDIEVASRNGAWAIMTDGAKLRNGQRVRLRQESGRRNLYHTAFSEN